MTDKPWIGWHFLPGDKKMRWGSRRIVKVGERRSCNGKLELCENGLHASERPIDALMYAPGPIVCKVALSGEILESTDKACARYRSVSAMADATTELHLFACWCAEKALRAQGETDPRFWAAIKAKRDWLKGKITSAQLAAAARSAASAAAAARSAASAWSANAASAWSANAASAAAARSAAGAAQNTELLRRFNRLLRAQ